MKKASDYRFHAEECRKLARTMQTEEDKRKTLEMADLWEKMAADCAAFILRHPELSHPGEHDEEHG